MTGQEAVNVAQAFQERVAFDGVVLTKLDGDARGGAALSVKAVTGKPIKLASVGEKLDAARVVPPRPHGVADPRHGRRAHADREAEAAVEDDEKRGARAPHDAGRVHLRRLPQSYKMMRRMGPLQGVLKMIPGLGKQLEGLDQVDESQLAGSRRSSSR